MNITWGLLSKYRNELYGFSIIWIILFHGLELKNCSLNKIIKFFDGFIRHGNCGVDVFLFLSGVYLYYSLSKDNNIISFYKKRFFKIIFPFVLIDGIYWSYTTLYLRGDVTKFISDISLYSFWSGYDKQVWFIGLIVVLYALYPIIYKYILNNQNHFVYMILMCIFTYAFCYGADVYFHKWFYRVEIALVRIPVFLFGCYCGMLVYENREICTGVKITSLLCILFGAYYFYQHPFSLVKAYRLPYLFIGPSIAIWFCIVLEVINNQQCNGLLCKWGGVSLELYLSHIVLRKLYIKSFMYGNNSVQNFYVYFLFVFLGSYIISKFVRKINNMLIC